MMLHLRDVRSVLSKKTVGVFIAAASLLALVSPASALPLTPKATLSSDPDLSSYTLLVNQPLSFSSTITKDPDSSTPNVRVKTALTDPNQAVNIVYEYESDPGVYSPMVFDENGVAYYGGTLGFPLTTASSNMRLTFKISGTYQATSQIVDALTGAPIGNAVVANITVKDPEPVVDQPPVLAAPTHSRNSDGSYTITGSANENLSEALVSLNGDSGVPATITGSTWSFTTDVLTDGDYSVAVRAKDMNGNPGTLAEDYKFTVLTPFTPQVQPVIAESAPIITSEADISVAPVSRPVYVADTKVTPDTTTNKSSSVLGATTTKDIATTPAQIIQPSEQGWKIWGMAWYWWAAIVGALGAVSWVSTAWFRGRS